MVNIGMILTGMVGSLSSPNNFLNLLTGLSIDLLAFGRTATCSKFTVMFNGDKEKEKEKDHR